MLSGLREAEFALRLLTGDADARHELAPKKKAKQKRADSDGGARAAWGFPVWGPAAASKPSASCGPRSRRAMHVPQRSTRACPRPAAAEPKLQRCCVPHALLAHSTSPSSVDRTHCGQRPTLPQSAQLDQGSPRTSGARRRRPGRRRSARRSAAAAAARRAAAAARARARGTARARRRASAAARRAAAQAVRLALGARKGALRPRGLVSA
jgi:hypothetical protein